MSFFSEYYDAFAQKHSWYKRSQIEFDVVLQFDNELYENLQSELNRGPGGWSQPDHYTRADLAGKGWMFQSHPVQPQQPLEKTLDSYINEISSQHVFHLSVFMGIMSHRTLQERLRSHEKDVLLWLKKRIEQSTLQKRQFVEIHDECLVLLRMGGDDYDISVYEPTVERLEHLVKRDALLVFKNCMKEVFVGISKLLPAVHPKPIQELIAQYIVGGM
jgi:hypothetical protein